MPMERRKGDDVSTASPLPKDYIKMVTEVFTTNFDAGLKALRPLMKGEPSFDINGMVLSDELVLCATLVEEGAVAATSVYASIDFDPKASAPTIQDLLSACVDAVGSVYTHLLDPTQQNRLEQVAANTLSVMDNVPFHWTEMKVDHFRIYLKVDKSNPTLERIADDWLSKNDPGLKKLKEENEEEVKKLFVTGPTHRRPGGASGTGGLH